MALEVKPDNADIGPVMKAVEQAGYQAGKDIYLAMDCAATEFFKNGVYDYEGEGKKRSIKEQAETGAFADGKHGRVDAPTSAVMATKAPAVTCAPKSAATTTPVQAYPPPPPKAADAYLEFTAQYSQVVEDFMRLQSLKDSKEYILK